MVQGFIDTPADLGRVVAEIRHAHGLSQDEMSSRLRVSQRYLSELERGKPKVFDERFIRVLNELGIRLTFDLVP
jgi:transcriptional regulator with XRE-family HTH domain